MHHLYTVRPAVLFYHHLLFIAAWLVNINHVAALLPRLTVKDSALPHNMHTMCS
jgi:hypothetical protein